jgi:hypothetical protein
MDPTTLSLLQLLVVLIDQLLIAQSTSQILQPNLIITRLIEYNRKHSKLEHFHRRHHLLNNQRLKVNESLKKLLPASRKIVK